MGAHNDNKSNKSYMWLLLRLPLLLLPLLLLPLLLLPLLLLLLSSPLLPPLLLLPLLLLPLLLPIPPTHSAQTTATATTYSPALPPTSATCRQCPPPTPPLHVLKAGCCQHPPQEYLDSSRRT